MKRYYVKEETPLKFHYFLCVVLWINGIAVGWRLINLVDQLHMEQTDAVGIGLFVYGLYYVPAICMRFAAAWGLRSFAKYAWYCAISFSYWDMGMFFCSAGATVLLNIQDGTAGELLAQAIVTGICAVFIHVYYVKRKPLFFRPKPQSENPLYAARSPATPPVSAPAAYRPMDPPPPASTPVQKAVFCRQCGNKLSPGSVFCGKCGARLSRPEK